MATPSRAYCAQQPSAARVGPREHPLWRPARAARYREAIRLAALEADLRQLSEGDATNAGEGGINLSSGQRARVPRARNYADADLLILDDIFAAVDAHTGAQLWEALMLLLRREKTVVVATHQIQLLTRPEVSRIALMRDGAPPRATRPPSRRWRCSFAATLRRRRRCSRRASCPRSMPGRRPPRTRPPRPPPNRLRRPPEPHRRRRRRRRRRRASAWPRASGCSARRLRVEGQRVEGSSAARAPSCAAGARRSARRSPARRCARGSTVADFQCYVSEFGSCSRSRRSYWSPC